MKDPIYDNDFGGLNESSDTDFQQLQLLGSAQHVHRLFRRLNWHPKLTPGLLYSAFQLGGKESEQPVLLENTRLFFRQRAILIPEGLETLPSRWLETIPQVLLETLKPHWHHIPYMITSLRLCNSVLCVSFAQEGYASGGNRLTRWDQLRITLNRCIRPNLWTALTSEERLAIWNSHHELREELVGFYPQVQAKLK
jgi:hypothetical protein